MAFWSPPGCEAGRAAGQRKTPRDFPCRTGERPTHPGREEPKNAGCKILIQSETQKNLRNEPNFGNLPALNADVGLDHFLGKYNDFSKFFKKNIFNFLF
jgi:hypothetical protein